MAREACAYARGHVGMVTWGHALARGDMLAWGHGGKGGMRGAAARGHVGKVTRGQGAYIRGSEARWNREIQCKGAKVKLSKG